MILFDTVSPIPIDSTSLVGLCIVSALFFLLVPFQKSSFPLVNEKKPLEFRPLHAQRRFLQNAKQIIIAGFSKADIFRVVSDNGIKTVLDPKYAEDIRSHPALSFGGSIAREFHSNVRGFEPFKQGSRSDEILQYAIRVKLTQSLGNVTEPLSSETTVALENAWTNVTEWHDINLRPTLLNMVAQLSSKVFLGDKICRNPDWLRITVNYTVDSFVAARELRFWPTLLRPFIANFLPSCRKIQQQIQQARDIIEPVLEERRKAKEAEASTGAPRERYVDAMQWMEDSAKGAPYDPAVAQLTFSLAAIHTTSDMLNQVLVDLCGKDKLIQELREEIILVITQDGWKKTTLYKLKLMDSVLKESQRLKPISIVTMRRYAERDIKLSDGTILPKGTNLLVSNKRMWDADFYSDPETFDPYRFLKLREVPGHETSAQVASPSPEHMGFGFGKHACPGRFFAVNEVKIALCHILLKYDIRLAERYTPMKMSIGVSLNADPRARIAVKRRQEEIIL